jgi:hydroxypyruvate isomerase
VYLSSRSAEAAASNGFEAVEIDQPYDTPIPELESLMSNDEAGGTDDLECVCIGTHLPHTSPSRPGYMGFAAVPGAEQAFDQSLTKTFAYARALRCKNINVLCGVPQAGLPAAASAAAARPLGLSVSPSHPHAGLNTRPGSHGGDSSPDSPIGADASPAPGMRSTAGTVDEDATIAPAAGSPIFSGAATSLTSPGPSAAAAGAGGSAAAATPVVHGTLHYSASGVAPHAAAGAAPAAAVSAPVSPASAAAAAADSAAVAVSAAAAAGAGTGVFSPPAAGLALSPPGAASAASAGALSPVASTSTAAAAAAARIEAGDAKTRQLLRHLLPPHLAALLKAAHTAALSPCQRALTGDTAASAAAVAAAAAFAGAAASVSASVDDAAFATLVANLQHASRRAKAELGPGYVLLLEPVSDVPGYWLDSLYKALRVIAHVDCDNVALLFDCYHVQRLHGNVTELLLGLLPLVRHVQAASSPHRREIDRGELNYMYVLRQLDRAGYQGWCGLEYAPTGGKTKQNLQPWFATFQRRRHGSAGILVACVGKQGKPYLLLGEDHKKGRLWGPFWGRPDKTDKDVEHTAVRETVEESLGCLAPPSILYNALKHADFHVTLPSAALFLVSLGVLSAGDREAYVERYRAAREAPEQRQLSKVQQEMTELRWVDATELLRTYVLKKKGPEDFQLKLRPFFRRDLVSAMETMPVVRGFCERKGLALRPISEMTPTGPVKGAGAGAVAVAAAPAAVAAMAPAKSK